MELRALGKVKMFGQYYLAGQTLPEVDEAEAVRLVALGVAEYAGAVSAAPAAPASVAALAAVPPLPEVAGLVEMPGQAPQIFAGLPPMADLPPLEDLPPAGKTPEEMSKAELVKELTARGIAFDKRQGHAALVPLLAAALDAEYADSDAEDDSDPDPLAVAGSVAAGSEELF